MKRVAWEMVFCGVGGGLLALALWAIGCSFWVLLAACCVWGWFADEVFDWMGKRIAQYRAAR